MAGVGRGRNAEEHVAARMQKLQLLSALGGFWEGTGCETQQGRVEVEWGTRDVRARWCFKN